MSKLITSQNTTRVERLVRSAFTQKYGRRRDIQAVFEHDQWWIVRGSAIYSAVDAEPGIGTTGIDFEQVSQ